MSCHALKTDQKKSKRARQRANRRAKEARIPRRDYFGYDNPTPHEAVNQIVLRQDLFEW